MIKKGFKGKQNSLMVFFPRFFVVLGPSVFMVHSGLVFLKWSQL